MDMTNTLITAGATAISLYGAVQAGRTIRRVGFMRFSKALLVLIGAFLIAGVKAASGVFSGRRKADDAVGKASDPFLSPLEKSPAAQSPLIENPIDNPEGYYVDD